MIQYDYTTYIHMYLILKKHPYIPIILHTSQSKHIMQNITKQKNEKKKKRKTKKQKHTIQNIYIFYNITNHKPKKKKIAISK